MESELYPVVLVDDADDVRSVVGRQLRLSRRFTIVGEGRTGADAIALAARHRPALMVLDASMPEMDGLEALPAVRRVSPATRVVMLSGFGGPALEMAARALGAADFVEKASPIRELPGRLLRLLEGAGPAPQPHGGDDGTEDDEAVLAQHLERFRTVFDQAAIGMATMTLSGTIVRGNLALVRLTGQAETELAGRRYSDLAGPESREALREALADMGRGQCDVAEVDHSLAGTGEERWIHSTLTVVRDAAGRPLYLFAQAVDITQSRLALEELRGSEERFRLLVEAVTDYAIFMLDPEGRVTTWNAGAERLKGYRAEDITGQHFRVFYPPEMQEIRHPEHELELAIRDGRYEEEGWRIRRDGTRFWANVVITALFDGDGRLVGFGKVTRDMTERRLAEEARQRATTELAVANEQLRAANEQTTEFLAVTAHELRSPLAAITGAAGIIAEHWDELDAAEREENMQNLLRSAARTRRLLDDLLTASRLEAGSIEFEIDDVDLESAIHEAIAGAMKPSAAVDIVCPEGTMVRADRTRLVQTLINLLSNAVRHGQPPFVVEVRPAGGNTEVRVCDSGPGVPADVRPLLFKKFVRGRGRPDRGTGLGLFIVRQLTLQQGGEAWYEPDGGRSCFAFSLPARTPEPSR